MKCTWTIIVSLKRARALVARRRGWPAPGLSEDSAGHQPPRGDAHHRRLERIGHPDAPHDRVCHGTWGQHRQIAEGDRVVEGGAVASLSIGCVQERGWLVFRPARAGIDLYHLD